MASAAVDPIARMFQAVLASLREYDFKHIVDESLSTMAMDAFDLEHPELSPITRMQAIIQAVGYIQQITDQADDDGCQIRFLNDKREFAIPKGGDTKAVFDEVCPMGMGMGGDTPTCSVLGAELETYMTKYRAKPRETKKMVFLVYTDGESTDGVDAKTGERTVLHDLIAKYAIELNKLGAPKDQIGIQFLQVGNDEGARKELTTLDDLNVGGRDMVDTTFYHPAIPLHVLALKAIAGPVKKDLDDEKTLLNLAKMARAYAAKVAAAKAETTATAKTSGV